ncbi:MAG: hypothetical protein AAF512_02425 [Pseudomonadota bacterium]
MLPLRKITLFKHGVGYFEREGDVEGNETIELYFQAEEMNDVLKSLTAIDDGSGVVTSVSYESTLPLEKQLADLDIRLPRENVLSGLFAQLPGASVQLDIESKGQPTIVTGRIVGVEMVERHNNSGLTKHPYLSLMTSEGELKAFSIFQATNITLLDEPLKQDLQRLLNVLIDSKKQDTKRLRLMCRGEGVRRLTVGYLVETPVWKTSYRLLLQDKNCLLQGWAIVDNPQDEDWEDVQLSLVSGLPVSFTHNLYSPRYQQRPDIPVKTAAPYAPREMEEAIMDASVMEELGFDDLDDEMAPTEAAAMPAESAPRSRSVRMANAFKQTAPTATSKLETSDLFSYNIENPVSVGRRESALAPILSGECEAERVAVYNPDVRQQNPMAAILLKNTTGLTLEGGPITVFEEDAYVGEAMLNTLRDAAEQLVPFAVELGCLVDIEKRNETEKTHTIEIRHGSVYSYHDEADVTTYILNNKTNKKLDVFIEHHFRRGGWELLETPELVERTESFYRFRVSVPSGKRVVKFNVTETIERCGIQGLGDVTDGDVQLWVSQNFFNRKIIRGLEDLLAVLAERRHAMDDCKQREKELNALNKNHLRLRDSLKALGNQSDEIGVRDNYLKSMMEEEQRINQCRDEIAVLQARTSDLNTQFEELMEALEYRK